MSSSIDVLLHEDRKFPPAERFRQKAHIRDWSVHQRAEADFEGYWAEEAHKLDWIKPWSSVLEWNPPRAKWFVGGKLNVAANCLDRHINTSRRNKAALVWEGEPGDRRTLTYWDLYCEVRKFANVLKTLGVRKGDRVGIYLPMIPEAAVAMLACARIGAIHSVVFGGFSPESLRDRMNDAKAKVVITADGGYRRGQVIPLKRNTDKALEDVPSVEHVVVVRRRPGGFGDDSFSEMREGRDHWWHQLMQHASMESDPEPMDAEDVLFILYTSGTTGKPKGIVHTTGGYLVYAAMTHQYTFDYQEGDVFWCTADVGWVTGHSYIIYGPLANGATTLMFEGVPTFPDAGRFWEVCAKHGVTQFYTAPTAIRSLMGQGAEWVENSRPWLGTTWEGTAQEKKAVTDDLNRAARWARQHRRPLYMGEFGAYSKADIESRARWTRFLAEEAAKRGISSAYWEFGSGFGAYRPQERKWREPLLEALGKVLAQQKKFAHAAGLTSHLSNPARQARLWVEIAAEQHNIPYAERQ